MKPILILPLLLLTACAGGRYVGPSLGVSVGYNGIAVGVTLYGNNAVAQATATPSPSPTPAAKIGLTTKTRRHEGEENSCNGKGVASCRIETVSASANEQKKPARQRAAQFFNPSCLRVFVVNPLS
ncbi:MAG: hypothetical protein QM796_18405 [Chthoniobacteraceae bacterium]